MTLDDLKKLESEIKDHRNAADRLKRQAEDVANMRRKPTGVPHVTVDKTIREGGLDTDERMFSLCRDKDAAFAEVWEAYGRDLLRLTEMKLQAQAREHSVHAQTKQARLDALLAGAGEVEPQ